MEAAGRLATEWVDTEDVLAVPYDTPVPGYRNDTVNTLRLWSAGPPRSSTCATSTRGTTCARSRTRRESENITKVLYPNDNVSAGQELRLRQEYLFCRRTLQDIIRRYKKHYLLYDDQKGLRPFDRFAERTAIQLNDTHPALAIPELMRILRRRGGARLGRGLGNHHRRPSPTPTTPCCPRRWSAGRSRSSAGCCRATCRSSTRSTTASSRGPRALPRRRRRAAARMSIIEEGGEQRVRMAHLAIVGGHAVNGVAALHTRDPQERRCSATSTRCGRRSSATRPTASRRAAGCKKANPRAVALITGAIGEGWVTDLASSSGWIPLADDAAFAESGAASSAANKAALKIIADQYEHRGTAIAVDPDSLFDVPGQAHPRVQAAAAERPARHHALQPDQGRPATASTCRAPSSSAARRRPAIAWPS